MHCTSFIDRVGRGLHSTVPGESEQAIIATLETLGEHLCGEEALILAARVAKELRKPLTKQSADARYYSPRGFYQRVAEKERVDVEKAAIHTAVVLKVLAVAVGEEVWDYVSLLLPQGLLESPFKAEHM